jgi:hypothetical protein
VLDTAFRSLVVAVAVALTATTTACSIPTPGSIEPGIYKEVEGGYRHSDTVLPI